MNKFWQNSNRDIKTTQRTLAHYEPTAVSDSEADEGAASGRPSSPELPRRDGRRQPPRLLGGAGGVEGLQIDGEEEETIETKVSIKGGWSRREDANVQAGAA